MQVLADNCDGCARCAPYCPAEAISVLQDKAVIDAQLCVECGSCLRSGVCESEALFRNPLEWPRLLRARFSDPLVTHPSTGIWGRGTTEMKTSDVTGRYAPGWVGLVIEMGRPGITADFNDVETVALALAGKVEFEQCNPVVELIDPQTGRLLREEVRRERVLSAILECRVPETRALEILDLLRDVVQKLQTVFSLSVICACVDGDAPFRHRLESAGFRARPNGKLNLGLGRPLA